MRGLAFVVVLLVLSLVPLRPARADGAMSDVRDGMAARARKPPDDDAARAAFQRAAGSSDPEAAAAALFFLGDMDEQAARFADAVASYDGALARLPSGRYAQRAAARSSAIKSHAEGDYAPLTRLERVRRDPSLSNDGAAIDALVNDADSFPPGLVRVEARLLAAEAYRGRLARPREQIALLWLVARDPKADVISAREAAVEIVDAEIQLGDLDAARAAAAELGTRVDAGHVTKVVHLLRRRLAHGVAIAALVATTALALFALLRGDARSAARAALGVLPTAAAFCAFAALAGGLLASTYESGSATPFLMVAPATLGAIAIARAWSAVGSKGLAARAARATLCAASVFAAALLLMERLTPEYLAGFGL